MKKTQCSPALFHKLSWIFCFCGLLLSSTACRSPDQGAGKIGPIKKWGVFVGERVHSTPAVDLDGNVYVGSADHHLYAFSSRGKFLWKYKVEGLTKVWSPSIGKDGTIAVATSDGQLVVLDSDGRLRWRQQPRKQLVGCAPIQTQGLILTSGDLVLVSYQAKDGKAAPLGKKLPLIKSCVSIGSQGHIYYSDHQKFYAWVLKDRSLQLLWSKTFSKTWSLPGFDPQGNLYIGTEDGKVMAMTSEGKALWEFQAPPLQDKKKGLFNRPVVSPVGQILATRFGEGLYAFSPRGQKLWVFPEGEQPFNGYITANKHGMIFTGSFDYHVYAITSQGKEAYRFFTNDRIYFAGALSPDHSTLYIGSEDKHLYALHTQKQKP